VGKEHYNLVFDGIDSIGQVKINNDVAVNVDNMFVRYVIPFKPQAVSVYVNMNILHSKVINFRLTL
jgi:beta-galactosidase/beta-glucuronidase